MRYLVIYDIPDDRIREGVANICLDYGLERIQYSAFWGDLSRNHGEELFLEIRRQLGRHPGDIRLHLMCERCLDSGRHLRQEATPDVSE